MFIGYLLTMKLSSNLTHCSKGDAMFAKQYLNETCFCFFFLFIFHAAALYDAMQDECVHGLTVKDEIEK